MAPVQRLLQRPRQRRSATTAHRFAFLRRLHLRSHVPPNHLRTQLPGPRNISGRPCQRECRGRLRRRLRPLLQLRLSPPHRHRRARLGRSNRHGRRQTSPIISPRSPDSLAEVAEPALTAAGNLWFWQPQVRFEQRFSFGDEAGHSRPGRLYQTNESHHRRSPRPASTLPKRSRPGLQGRVEFWQPLRWRPPRNRPRLPRQRQPLGGLLAFPPASYSVDWLFRPLRRSNSPVSSSMAPMSAASAA